MSKWNTTVEELMYVLKGALTALTPWLEKSKIPYKESEAYDDWDKITATLYESMVIQSIRFSEIGNIRKKEFAKYGFQYESYAELAFLICKKPNASDELAIFVSFSAEDHFEKVHTCTVNKNTLNVISRNKIPLSESEFYWFDNSAVSSLEIEV